MHTTVPAITPGRSVALRDGSTVMLRPVTGADRAVVARAFESLSPRSRFFRFHAPTPRYSAKLLDFLVAADGQDHVALLALDGERCVGIARYVRMDETTAEVAVTVVDGHQGRGLGRVLMDAITDAAAGHGIAQLHWLVHPENRRAIGLMRAMGVAFRFDDGVLLGIQEVVAREALAA